MTDAPKEVDDFLKHYGVQGMKWGKRSAGSSDASPKPTSSDILKARVLAGDKMKKVFTDEEAVIAAKTAKGRAAAEKVMNTSIDDYNKTAAIANQKTGLEKVGTVLAVVGTSLALASMVANTRR